jgi:hypothetical protein
MYITAAVVCAFQPLTHFHGHLGAGPGRLLFALPMMSPFMFSARFGVVGFALASCLFSGCKLPGSQQAQCSLAGGAWRSGPNNTADGATAKLPSGGICTLLSGKHGFPRVRGACQGVERVTRLALSETLPPTC